MNFDEIQSIWNSQAATKESLERESILLAVVEKEQSLRRLTTITDGVMIATPAGYLNGEGIANIATLALNNPCGG